jgi:hypothetical protein
MTRLKHTIDGKDLSIIAETANINYFLKTALEPDSETSVVNKSSSKKAHTRRKYVDDPAPSNVSPHDYEFMYDPGRIDLQTLPGKPFILDDGTERRQMTYVGAVMDLHSFLVGNAKMDLKLYTSGPPYVIAAAEDTLVQGVKA